MAITHSQLAESMSGTLRVYLKYASPLFPVRVWTRAGLSVLASSVWSILLLVHRSPSMPESSLVQGCPICSGSIVRSVVWVFRLVLL